MENEQPVTRGLATVEGGREESQGMDLTEEVSTSGVEPPPNVRALAESTKMSLELLAPWFELQCVYRLFRPPIFLL
jgi:hypothetical protein